MKIPLSQAHTYLSAVSRSKTYADEAAGVLTATKDPSRGNQKVVDIAELERVYGKVSDPNENPQDSETNGTGTQIDVEVLIQSYENRIQTLETQLELANQRETTLNTEKLRLLDMSDRMLALTGEKRQNWLLRFLGVSS